MHIGLTERNSAFHATGRLNLERFANVREVVHFVPIFLTLCCITVNACLPFVFDETPAQQVKILEKKTCASVVSKALLCFIQNFVQFLFVQCQILDCLFDVFYARFVCAVRTVHAIDTVLTVGNGLDWILFGCKFLRFDVFQCFLIFVGEHFDEFKRLSGPGSQNFLSNFRAVKDVVRTSSVLWLSEQSNSPS